LKDLKEFAEAQSTADEPAFAWWVPHTLQKRDIILSKINTQIRKTTHLKEGIQAPVGWSKMTGHLIWDVKMDLTRKTRWVLDGHKTPNPIRSTYAGVVCRDCIRIAFTHAAWIGLEDFAADIRNVCLQGLCCKATAPHLSSPMLGKIVAACVNERTRN
jgi:hypothetical protein